MKRIPVPAEAVRTREQILEGAVIRRTTDGVERVWVECHNCGGSGRYPSSLTPPGQCRFYCWQGRTADTYGKLPVDLETYVKRAQADDRREYRRKVQWELDAPKRAQEELEARERDHAEALELDARRTADLERKAVSQWQGVVGERLTVTGRVVLVRSFQQKAYAGYHYETRFVTKVRDDQGNIFVWFGGDERHEGDTLTVKGTVKEHGEYQGERQTTLFRVKEI